MKFSLRPLPLLNHLAGTSSAGENGGKGTSPMFRFTIRELLLVTALVAVCGAWWADRRAQTSDEQGWKFYATCLEKLLISDGFEILRDKDWVRATRISPSMTAQGSSNTAFAEPSSAHATAAKPAPPRR